MNVVVRSAVQADKARCLELLDVLGAGAGGWSADAAGGVFETLLSQDRGVVLVAEEGDQVLGMASLSFNVAMRYGGEYCQLEELIVDPEARGKNVGGLLMEEAVRQARRRHCGEFGLYLVETTEHNRPFYEKYGFTFVGSEMRQSLEGID